MVKLEYAPPKDKNQVRQAAEQYKTQAEMTEALAKDPQKVLEQFGVKVDDVTAKAIQAHASLKQMRPELASAGAIHIDF